MSLSRSIVVCRRPWPLLVDINPLVNEMTLLCITADEAFAMAGRTP